MQRRLTIPNPFLANNEKTYLSQDYNAGEGVAVISSYTFGQNDIVVAGNVGEKISESQPVASLTPPFSINLSNPFNFNHAKGTLLYKTPWDQISIEGQPSSGGWQVLNTIPIQWDKFSTIYMHTAGDDTWSYRFRFFNSILTIYSNYSHTQTGAGFARNMVGRMLLNVRKKIRDPNRVRYADADIIDLFNDGQFDTCAIVPKLWFLYVDTWETASPTTFGPLNSIGNGMVALPDTTRYALNQWPDLDSLDKIRYYYNNTGSFLLYDLQPLAYTDFDRFMFNQNRIKSDIVLSFKIVPPDGASAQGYFEVDPVNLGGEIGTFFPVYWRKPHTLSDIMDITDFPFPAMIEDYAAWKLHDWSGNTEEAAKYKDLYYGPSDETPIQTATGIKLLTMYNNKIRRANAPGRQLWNWRGSQSRNNFFGDGVINRDFIRENYL